MFHDLKIPGALVFKNHNAQLSATCLVVFCIGKGTPKGSSQISTLVCSSFEMKESNWECNTAKKAEPNGS